MSKQTPAYTRGPYTIEGAHPWFIKCQVGGNPDDLATVATVTYRPNAVLFHAAPDMLAELRRDLVFVREIKRLLIATKQRGTVQFQSAEMRETALLATIAKAEGRS